MEDELTDYISNAIKLAWNMITVHPPMVIDTPKTFSEKIHERQSKQWKEGLTKFDLVYMRPVLYESCNGEVAKKGWVGNEDRGPTAC